MIGASLLLLLLSSVTGEDYIINQEDPDWAVMGPMNILGL